jgi:ABC-2 type transport system ATP-binding protein
VSAPVEPVIELAGVGKRYVKYEDTPMLVSGALRLRSGNRRGTLWALRGVDLAVGRGETFGVIGRNGSGKSTMLRMLAGVTAPTEGVVRVRGRVAPLISVGVGFHAELTGRENVYVNGTVLGMTRQQIDERFDDIVAFAEIADFIDTPVKFYSSGMFVRLGFAVAVAAEPDVLLVDEVLAVGDLEFQMKCFARMQEMQAGGATIIVVSHNLNAIRNLCARVLVLDGGRPAFQGTADEAISAYHDLLAERTSTATSGRPAEILGFELLGPDGGRTAHVTAGAGAGAGAGGKATFRITARFNAAVVEPSFSFVLTSESGVPVYGDSTFVSGTRSFAAGEEVTCDVQLALTLTTGSYSAQAGVRFGAGPHDQVGSQPLLFYVAGRHHVHGVADLGATFDIH